MAAAAQTTQTYMSTIALHCTLFGVYGLSKKLLRTLPMEESVQVSHPSLDAAANSIFESTAGYSGTIIDQMLSTMG